LKLITKEGIMRMAYQPLEELLPKASMSVYRLVRLASMRATELATTGVKLVQVPADQKLATTALDEIRAGKVVEKGGDIFAQYQEAQDAKTKKHAKS
jgi:DNA-directed RNA polymerase subunit K/omega